MTITKTGLTYTATSLEDVVLEFERLANEAETRFKRASGGAGAIALGFKSEWMTWQQAAAILRATKLEPALPYAPPWPNAEELTSDNVGKSQTGLDRFDARQAARPKHRWSEGLNPVCRDCGKQWYVTIAGDPCVVREKRAN